MKRSTKRLNACVAAAALGLAAQCVNAGLITLGEQILNGDFGTNLAPSLASWTTVGVNARAASDTINTSTGAAGFNSFFTDAFAVLGDSTGTITAGGSGPTNGLMQLSQSFILPATVGLDTVTSYTLALSFLAAFDGVDTATAFFDLFSADLGANLVSWSSNADLGSTSTFSATLSGLAPGTYTISYSLTETNVVGGPSQGDTNTGAGVDKVSVSATALVEDRASVLRVPEPGILALMAGGLIGIGATRRRRGNAA